MVNAVQQNFLNRCSQANTLVDLAERKFSAWLSSIACAYSDAWTTHTKFITAIGTEAKLSQDLLLGAALALIPGAIGGVLGDIMKISKDASKDAWSAAMLRNRMTVVADVMIDLQLGAPTIDSIKDLVKWGLRSGAVIGRTGFSIPVADVYKKFPTDPLFWQSAINERVQIELANITELIEWWQNAVNTNDKQFVCNFDPYEQIRDALKIVVKNFDPISATPTDILLLVPVNQSDVSKLFQTGFLATWIDKYAWQASISVSPVTWDGWGPAEPLFGAVLGPPIKREIVDYGKRLGWQEIEAYMDACDTRDYVEGSDQAARRLPLSWLSAK